MWMNPSTSNNNNVSFPARVQQNKAWHQCHDQPQFLPSTSRNCSTADVFRQALTFLDHWLFLQRKKTTTISWANIPCFSLFFLSKWNHYRLTRMLYDFIMFCFVLILVFCPIAECLTGKRCFFSILLWIWPLVNWRTRHGTHCRNHFTARNL